MKIWLKVALVGVTITLLATGICTIIMLRGSSNNNLEIAIESALDNQSTQEFSFRNAMEQRLDDDFRFIAQRSLAHYLINQMANDSLILYSDREELFNPTNLEAIELLPIEGDGQQYIIVEIDGHSLLLTGSSFKFRETTYHFYHKRDITPIFSRMREMSIYYVLINIIVTLIGAIAIILLVRWIMAPIDDLKRNTALISQGVYDKRINLHQKDEIGQLAQDFNRMADAIEVHIHELQQEAERRTLFMSALTHELKTPMTAISGYAQTLLMTKIDEEQRIDALLRIDEECKRVERLSQKMMQLIFLYQGMDLEFKPWGAMDLLKDIESKAQLLLKKRNMALKVSCHSEHVFNIDIDLTEILLLNLIDNASKASKPGDVIELNICDNTIEIVDYGSGISNEDLRRIKDPFYMVDKSRSRKNQGIGMGLALSEAIAALHDAELIFESKPGKGTTVRVIF